MFFRNREIKIDTTKQTITIDSQIFNYTHNINNQITSLTKNINGEVEEYIMYYHKVWIDIVITNNKIIDDYQLIPPNERIYHPMKVFVDKEKLKFQINNHFTLKTDYKYNNLQETIDPVNLTVLDIKKNIKINTIQRYSNLQKIGIVLTISLTLSIISIGVYFIFFRKKSDKKFNDLTIQNEYN